MVTDAVSDGFNYAEWFLYYYDIFVRNAFGNYRDILDEEEHGAALHIIGVSSGSTSFQLQLMHDGHADYTSTNNVTVTVN